MTMMEVRRNGRGAALRARSGRITPLVLCGGAGSRLWPISRGETPKQFVSVLGGHTLYQQTLLRFAEGEAFDTPIVVTIEPFRFIAQDQARAVGVEAEIVLEPKRRGSAMAVAAGAELIRQRRPGALALAISADHSLLPGEAVQADGVAAAMAERGFIVAFGVRPTSPETSIGYIRPGDAIDEEIGDAAQRIAGLIENPDSDAAADCVRDGCLWNSGILLFSPATLATELARSHPALAFAARSAAENAEDSQGEESGSEESHGLVRLSQAPYDEAPTLSIEQALLDASDHVAVAPVSGGRTDIADWDALWRASEKDDRGNAAIGDVRLVDTSGTLAHSADGVLTTVLGAENLVVAATRDVVLVADRSRAEEVKPLVKALAAQGRPEASEGRKTLRPWGDVTAVERGERYAVKRITILPGRRVSLQRHYHRAEHWVVVRGVAEAERDGETLTIRENESLFLPQGCVHRIANPGKIPLELIEVQVGSYLGEDDVVRLEDDYRRGSPN